MVNGIDISNFQGNPDFSLLKSKIDFVIMKVSEGTGFTDPTFFQNHSNAKANGLLVGYYHFARPELGNSAQDEADYFLSIIQPLIQEGDTIFLDFETNFNGNAVLWCKQWLDRIQSVLNYKPLIYLNLSEINNNNWQPIVDANYGLWLADYDNNPNSTPNTPWPVVAFKQWKDNEQLPGISGNVDADVLFGDENTFKAYGYHAPTVVQSNSMVTTQPVNDATRIPIGVDSHGFDWGVMTIGAIRSTLGDKNNDLNNANSTITSLTATTQTMQKTINDLQNRLQALQTPVNNPSPVVSTSPKNAPKTAGTASGGLLSHLFDLLKLLFKTS